MGTPRCFHRPRRWRQKQPQNETSEQGNMSPQAAASQPSHYHPDTGSMDSPGRPVWHGGSPAGDGMPDPHLQTSQTAPAGWTGRWLQSLGQGESTASQISQNSPSSTSMHPNPILPLHQPPWMVGQALGRESNNTACSSFVSPTARTGVPSSAVPEGISFRTASPDHPL